jgi:hypothetical protein
MICVFASCADKQFVKQSSPIDCQGFGSSSCIKQGGFDVFDETLTGGGKIVDIIFVNDNSGSMSFEQNQIAARFSNFLAVLETKLIDYRIAIITTDTSSATNQPRPINKNGELLDGRPVKFDDGSFYLTPSSSNKTVLFSNAIRRLETKQCETFQINNASVDSSSEIFRKGLLDNCPGQDERGIRAANLFIQDQSKQILRNRAPLAMIFLSDEDERSGLYDTLNTYILDESDRPQNLISKVKQIYGAKKFNTYSIVVNPGTLNASAETIAAMLAETEIYNGQTVTKYIGNQFTNKDSACLNAQFNQLNLPADKAVSGSYGYVYALLAMMTNGFVGNICASDYTAQLNSIAGDIVDKIESYQLKCLAPEELNITTPPGLTYLISGTLVSFNRSLNPGEVVRFKYKCKSL